MRRPARAPGKQFITMVLRRRLGRADCRDEPFVRCRTPLSASEQDSWGWKNRELWARLQDSAKWRGHTILACGRIHELSLGKDVSGIVNRAFSVLRWLRWGNCDRIRSPLCPNRTTHACSTSPLRVPGRSGAKLAHTCKNSWVLSSSDSRYGTPKDTRQRLPCLGVRSHGDASRARQRHGAELRGTRTRARGDHRLVGRRSVCARRRRCGRRRWRRS